MINLIMVKNAAYRAKLRAGKFAGGVVIVAIAAIASPVFANTAATTTATSAAGATSVTVSASTGGQTTNEAGATSGGGSFFTPPEQVKAGSMTADQALKSTEVPEPGMIALFGGAAIMTLAVARRRRRK